MTIDEIKSVSIFQWMKENCYGDGIRRGKNIFYCSPLRTENTPSFAVNTNDNLWHDFGTGEGGNLINLVEKLNPTWSEHQVLAYLEKQIKEKGLQFNEDYNARLEESKYTFSNDKRTIYQSLLYQDTVVEMIIPLSHPYLRDYIIQRRIDYSIAQRFCREVHYTIRGKHYFSIAFMNIANGMEARNKLNKRCIGKKSISAIYPIGSMQKDCCVFEGFFDMMTYMTIESWMPDISISIGKPCDFFVLNGVGEVKILLEYIKKYDSIHCYLDNDYAGHNATKTIMSVYPNKTFDESYRYSGFNDLNDFLVGIK